MPSLPGRGTGRPWLAAHGVIAGRTGSGRAMVSSRVTGKSSGRPACLHRNWLISNTRVRDTWPSLDHSCNFLKSCCLQIERKITTVPESCWLDFQTAHLSGSYLRFRRRIPGPCFPLNPFQKEECAELTRAVCRAMPLQAGSWTFWIGGFLSTGATYPVAPETGCLGSALLTLTRQRVEAGHMLQAERREAPGFLAMHEDHRQPGVHTRASASGTCPLFLREASLSAWIEAE